MGMRRIRLANLPPEVTERNIRTALTSYGETVSFQDEIWSKAYRYKVANGINVIMMKLAKHLPSLQGTEQYGLMTGSQLHVTGVGTVDIKIRHALEGVEEVW